MSLNWWEFTSSISDHFLQFCVTDLFQTPKAKKRSKFARDFRNLNKREFGEELANINWSDIIEEIPDVDLCYSNFYKKIENILDFMAPYRKMTKKEVKLEQMPWITRGILVSMRVRDTLYKSWSSEKDLHYKSQIFTLYKRYRNIIVNLLRKSKGNYYSYFFLQNQSNVRKTWDGVRNLINVSKKKNTSPTKLIYKNEERFTNIDMAESLNDFFVNIGSSVEAKIPKSPKHFSSFLCSANNKSIFLTPCTSTEILTIINNMKSSKSCGPNSISINLLIEFSEMFVYPLVSIINLSLTHGVFPSLNKEADVCPIHKKDEKYRCENYRPISLLPNISKIFERVMYSRLDNFLNMSEIIYKFQFGFRKNYSTNHALLSIIEQIRGALDKNMFTCGVFIDLEKAFDTVNHQILVSKLNHYGIRGVANKWFSSYLSNRYQKVSLNGVSSQRLPITCGVPQGSILGPLLFLIYINDMNLAVEHSTIYHFADDTNLLYSCKSFKELRKRVNKDLQLLYEWLCANRLSLNTGKTEFIVFRPSRNKTSYRLTLKLHHTKLFESSKIKYLGIIIDNKLNWKGHIAELSKKLSRAVGLIYKIRHMCPTAVLRSLYFSLFHSHLSYGLVLWGTANQSYIDKIRTLQNRALKAIAFTNNDINTNTNHIYFDLKILNIDHQLQVQLSSLMWDYDHNTLPYIFKRSF